MSTIPERLEKLRAKMQEKGIDIYIIPTADFHQSEYVGEPFKAREYINRHILNDIEKKKLFYDSKTILQEIVQGEHLDMEYELLKEEGPDHNKSFTVAVNIGGERFTTAAGRTKKKAEQSAAYQAILKLHK